MTECGKGKRTGMEEGKERNHRLKRRTKILTRRSLRTKKTKDFINIRGLRVTRSIKQHDYESR